MRNVHCFHIIRGLSWPSCFSKSRVKKIVHCFNLVGVLSWPSYFTLARKGGGLLWQGPMKLSGFWRFEIVFNYNFVVLGLGFSGKLF